MGRSNVCKFAKVVNKVGVDLTLIWNHNLSNAEKAIREMRSNRSGIWSVAYIQANYGVGDAVPTRTAVYGGVGGDGLPSTVLQHSLVYDLICHHHHLKVRNGKDWNACMVTAEEMAAQYKSNNGKRLWSSLIDEDEE